MGRNLSDAMIYTRVYISVCNKPILGYVLSGCALHLTLPIRRPRGSHRSRAVTWIDSWTTAHRPERTFSRSSELSDGRDRPIGDSGDLNPRNRCLPAWFRLYHWATLSTISNRPLLAARNFIKPISRAIAISASSPDLPVLMTQLASDRSSCSQISSTPRELSSSAGHRKATLAPGVMPSGQ